MLLGLHTDEGLDWPRVLGFMMVGSGLMNGDDEDGDCTKDNGNPVVGMNDNRC